jgi:hypothetical protein
VTDALHELEQPLVAVQQRAADELLVILMGGRDEVARLLALELDGRVDALRKGQRGRQHYDRR